MASETKIKVRTTLPRHPFPPNTARAPIETEHLIIKPLTQADLGALHALRTQSEVMACTALGKVDADISETQAKLDPFLPPRDADTYNPGIYLATTKELIGLGGVFGGTTSEELGWPEVGYMIRKEHWGKGYATEFLRAFVREWWRLPRSEGEGVMVDRLSVGEDAEGETVPEMLCAIVDRENAGSTRVMEKAGFKKFKSWTVASRRPGEEGKEVTLVGFVVREPLPGS